MKPVQYYACEICGTEHSTEKLALACEKYHVLPRKIEKKVQKKMWAPYPGATEADKYPSEINVEMEDGSVWTYEISKIYRAKK